MRDVCMDGIISTRSCTLCGKHMTFEGAADSLAPLKFVS
jgi:hypothetical protein